MLETNAGHSDTVQLITKCAYTVHSVCTPEQKGYIFHRNIWEINVHMGHI